MTELAAKIREALEEFWDERAIPIEGGETTCINDLIGPVESMTAVDVLVTLDAIVGTKLPNTVIKVGGYQTRDEFVNELGASVLANITAKSKS